MDTIKIDSRNTKMIAHRGLCGIEKENTLAAFIAAGNRSYFGIETDVHKTRDGRFVTIHDDSTGRVAIDDLSVENSTFDTLRRLLLTDRDGKKGREDLHIPTLSEYISACRRYEKKAILELKNEFTGEEIGLICEEIRQEEYLENVVFISFCFDNLVRLREFLPLQPVQFLTGKYSDDLPSLLSEHRFDLDIRYTEIDGDKIALLHEKGVKVNAWTCNNKEAAEALCRSGIDFLTTNILE